MPSSANIQREDYARDRVENINNPSYLNEVKKPELTPIHPSIMEEYFTPSSTVNIPASQTREEFEKKLKLYEKLGLQLGNTQVPQMPVNPTSFDISEKSFPTDVNNLHKTSIIANLRRELAKLGVELKDASDIYDYPWPEDLQKIVYNEQGETIRFLSYMPDAEVFKKASRMLRLFGLNGGQRYLGDDQKRFIANLEEKSKEYVIDPNGVTFQGGNNITVKCGDMLCVFIGEDDIILNYGIFFYENRFAEKKQIIENMVEDLTEE